MEFLKLKKLRRTQGSRHSMLDDPAIRYKQHDLVQAQGRSIASTLVGKFGDFRYSAHITRYLVHGFFSFIQAYQYLR